MHSINKVFTPMILPILFLLLSFFLVKEYLPHEKSKINLLVVGFVMGLLICISFIIQYLVSEDWRKQINSTISQFIRK
jgi:hypothetical protein